jgi:hypothetical protein
MTKCYLLAWIERGVIDNEDLVVTAARFASEPPWKITHDIHNELPVVVYETEGESYAEAVKALRDLVGEHLRLERRFVSEKKLKRLSVLARVFEMVSIPALILALSGCPSSEAQTSEAKRTIVCSSGSEQSEQWLAIYRAALTGSPYNEPENAVAFAVSVANLTHGQCR